MSTKAGAAGQRHGAWSWLVARSLASAIITGAEHDPQSGFQELLIFLLGSIRNRHQQCKILNHKILKLRQTFVC